jgi:hypothetical protein
LFSKVILFPILFTGEQKEDEPFVFRTKLAVNQAETQPVLFCEFRRSDMTQMKATIPKTLAAESEQAIHFLTRISDELKHQRRHFDDAVVIHCIRLINDYVDEKGRESFLAENQSSSGSA